MMRCLYVGLLLTVSATMGCGPDVPISSGGPSSLSSPVDQAVAPAQSPAPAQSRPSVVATATEVAATPEVETPAQTKRENVTFKAGSGDRLYEVKFEADGAKLVDPDEKEIARFNVAGQKVKVKLADDSVVAYIVVKAGEFQIRDESQKTELFELKGQSDGDWKLKDGEDHLLAVIKKRDYGFEIEDGAEKSLFKSKLKDGKRSLRNANDETVLYTKDEFPPLGVACLGLEQIESLPVRAGLAVALLFFAE